MVEKIDHNFLLDGHKFAQLKGVTIIINLCSQLFHIWFEIDILFPVLTIFVGPSYPDDRSKFLSSLFSLPKFTIMLIIDNFKTGDIILLELIFAYMLALSYTGFITGAVFMIIDAVIAVIFKMRAIFIIGEIVLSILYCIVGSQQGVHPHILKHVRVTIRIRT